MNLNDADTSESFSDPLASDPTREHFFCLFAKSFSEWLGEIAGTLDFPEAKPPIEPELLAQSKKDDARDGLRSR